MQAEHKRLYPLIRCPFVDTARSTRPHCAHPGVQSQARTEFFKGTRFCRKAQAVTKQRRRD